MVQAVTWDDTPGGAGSDRSRIIERRLVSLIRRKVNGVSPGSSKDRSSRYEQSRTAAANLAAAQVKGPGQCLDGGVSCQRFQKVDALDVDAGLKASHRRRWNITTAPERCKSLCRTCFESRPWARTPVCERRFCGDAVALDSAGARRRSALIDTLGAMPAFTLLPVVVLYSPQLTTPARRS